MPTASSNNQNTNLKRMSNTITSEIKFVVELDENRVPEKLTWTAQDGGVDLEEAKAMLLSIWDSKAKETLTY